MKRLCDAEFRKETRDNPVRTRLQRTQMHTSASGPSAVTHPARQLASLGRRYSSIALRNPPSHSGPSSYVNPSPETLDRNLDGSNRPPQSTLPSLDPVMPLRRRLKGKHLGKKTPEKHLKKHLKDHLKKKSASGTSATCGAIKVPSNSVDSCAALPARSRGLLGHVLLLGHVGC